jgi:hypothetical protein
MLWVSSSAGSAPSRSPARPTVLSNRGEASPRGEAFAVAGRRDAGVVWAEGFTFRLESEDDWVGIALGPSEAPAGPPHEVLLLLFAIHAPPFSGGRGRAMGPAATYLRIPKGCELVGE